MLDGRGSGEGKVSSGGQKTGDLLVSEFLPCSSSSLHAFHSAKHREGFVFS